MNYYVTIATETIGLTGYKTIKHIETIPRDEALRKVAEHTIVRRFISPFNSSIEVIVIK